MDYPMPESHLELLQGIYRELVLARDINATFKAPGEAEEVTEES